MIHFFEKFKIPTFLGLAVIIIGIASGIFLVMKDQTFLSRASPDVTPQNVTFTNIADSTIVASWKTSSPTASFITFGQNSPSEQTALDDRDQKSPSPHTIHYVTFKNLLPKSEYQMKITTGRISSAVFKFKTASPISSQNNFGPVIGSVLEGTKPLSEGVAYLSIANATVQSYLIKDLGSFLIPLPQIRKADLSDIFAVSDDMVAKLVIIGKNAQATVLFKLQAGGVSLPVLKLGQNLDLTTLQTETKQATLSDSKLEKDFDLNSDGKINAADNAILLQNFGKNPKNKKADLDGDGEVTKKDLDLMSKQINQ